MKNLEDDAGFDDRGRVVTANESFEQSRNVQDLGNIEKYCSNRNWKEIKEHNGGRAALDESLSVGIRKADRVKSFNCYSDGHEDRSCDGYVADTFDHGK